MLGLLDTVDDAFGAAPERILADTGYCNEPELAELERRGIDTHVAVGHEGRQTAAPDPQRRPATHRMRRKLATARGQATYGQRKWLSEAPMERIKEGLGFRRFSVRGLD